MVPMNGTYELYLCDWSGSVPESNVIKNNIFIPTGTGSRAVGSMVVSGTSFDVMTNTFDYNLYYYTNSSAGDKSDLIVNHTLAKGYTFGQWQALGKEQHGILADPKLNSFSTYNFHLTSSSPMIDKGQNVGVSSDKDGNSRPKNSGYDIGAYEYTASISAVVPSPTPTTPKTSTTPQPTTSTNKPSTPNTSTNTNSTTDANSPDTSSPADTNASQQEPTNDISSPTTNKKGTKKTGISDNHLVILAMLIAAALITMILLIIQVYTLRRKHLADIAFKA